ncbi:MAG: 3-methyl-2-oxobutanoate hydroxymethyltransferase [Thermoanaerobaculia bacterium]|nr:3-methyl-2-oxobutanoate hydroxymethyltransferase [Thermoanaerobaculia bacterium]
MTQLYGGTGPIPRMTAPQFRALKGVRKLAALTAYDAPTAALLDSAGVDLLLVGDSIEMVVYGAADTLGASLDRMVGHARAVSGASRRALVVGDMPYLTYHTTPAEAVRNASRFVVEGGCRAVKLEGGAQRLVMIEAILNAEIPVMGHIGLTPQSIHALGGFKVQGRSRTEAERLLDDAQRLAEAGVFALVLECVPADLAAQITESVPVPTIGIGAGPYCDGQILVLHDLVGLTAPGARIPKFVKRYADVGSIIAEAAREYVKDVTEGAFPASEDGERAVRKPAGEVVPFAAHHG